MERESRTENPEEGPREQPPVVSANADWDYQVMVPTNWYIRGKNPKMHLLTDEQMDALDSGGNPWPQNFFFATFSLAAALLIQLKAGVIDVPSRHDLWNAFFVMVIMAAFFGILAIRDYLKTKNQKREIKRNAPSAQAEAPTLRAKGMPD